MTKPVILLALALLAAACSAPAKAVPGTAPPVPAAPAAGPEAPDATDLDVMGAVTLALAMNPDLRIAAARIAGAQAAVREAQAARYPQLSLAAGYVHSNDPVNVFMWQLRQRELSMNTDFNHPGHHGNTRASAELGWLIFDGGRRAAGEDLARLGVLIAEGDRAAVMNELKAAVIATCLTVLETREFIRVGEQSVGVVGEQLRISRERFEAGAAQRSDVLSVEVRLAEAEEALVRARNAEQRTLTALRTLLGLSADAPLRFGVAPGFVVPPVPEEGRFALARANRPELRRAADAVRAAEREIDLHEAERLPTVTAFGSYDVDDRTLSLGLDRDSRTAGVRVELPLIAGGRIGARVAGARERFVAAREMERKVALAVEADVRRAELDLAEARERLRVSEKTEEQAEEALGLIGARYESGAATITEYLDAEVALTGARVRKVSARFGVERATADLRRAMGICRAGQEGGR